VRYLAVAEQSASLISEPMRSEGSTGDFSHNIGDRNAHMTSSTKPVDFTEIGFQVWDAR
jgi:hypothetical protein